MGKNYETNYHAEYFVKGYSHDHNSCDFGGECFRIMAKKIVDIFAPKTFLDVGRSRGYLVEALRDLGVEAYGVDISSRAINMVREDIKPYCFVANVLEGLPDDLPEHFDCISIIEVAQHFNEEYAQSLISVLCSYTDIVLFSSTSDNHEDKTLCNLQQQEYWSKRFALEGFLRDLVVDVSFISPDAFVYRKEEKTKLRLIEDYERAARLERISHKKELQSVIKNKDDLINNLEKLCEEDQQKREKLREDMLLEREHQNKLLQEIIDANYEKIWEGREQTRKYGKELEDIRIREHELKVAYDAIVNSTSWKMTLPFRRIVDSARNLFSSKLSTSNVASSHASSATSEAVTITENHPIPASIYWRTRYSSADPINTSLSDKKLSRLNLVVDGINDATLLGGVATSLILATLFVARHKDMALRIITRYFPADPLDYLNIMELNGIAPARNVEYYSDYDRDKYGQSATKMPLSSEDIFMASSWWSAKAIEKTSLRRRFFYIIQEVESFFYPYGDERLLCKQVMQNPNINFIVNSHYLWDYFNEFEPNITRRGIYFEPAFSKSLYPTKQFSSKKKGEKYILFFYTRPNNPRNLFSNGLLFLDEAIRQGVLNTDEWEICFAGQDIPDIIFCDGTKPKVLGQLSWDDYRYFLNGTDLAMSLMYTPHPSYPPYDVAVSGGVVVTNKFMNKTSFNQSDNVIMAELNIESFLKALDKGVQLAKNQKQREENYKNTSIERDWEKTLQTVLKKMDEWL